jgi:hypothetical protein
MLLRYMCMLIRLRYKSVKSLGFLLLGLIAVMGANTINFPFLNDSTHIYLIFKLGLKGAAISFVSGFKIVTTLNLIYDHM